MQISVLYIGSAGDLKKRIYFHRKRLMSGFSKKYNITRLVYFEEHQNQEMALQREIQVKKYRREKKIRLILGENPGWLDLYDCL